MPGLHLPLPKALVVVQLPLSGEIVTADVSRVIMRVRGSLVGVAGQQRTRGVGSKEAWWSHSRGSWGEYMYWEFTDPAGVSYDPALPQQPAIPFSAVLRNPDPIPRAPIHMPCLIGNELFQPTIGERSLPRNATRHQREKGIEKVLDMIRCVALAVRPLTFGEWSHFLVYTEGKGESK